MGQTNLFDQEERSNMGELSAEEIQVIASHPIGGALEPFRQSFRSVCNKLGLTNSPESTKSIVSSDGMV